MTATTIATPWTTSHRRRLRATAEHLLAGEDALREWSPTSLGLLKRDPPRLTQGDGLTGEPVGDHQQEQDHQNEAQTDGSGLPQERLAVEGGRQATLVEDAAGARGGGGPELCGVERGHRRCGQ